MENEVPKKAEATGEAKATGETVATGETMVREVVVEETVIVTSGVAPEAEGAMEAGVEPVQKKPTLKEMATKACGFVSRVDRTTKTFVVIFGVFALLFAGYVYFKDYFVAATIDGREVSRWSVVRELEKQAGKSVLDTMITKQLIESEIKKQKIVVAPADVDAEIKKVEEQIAAQGGTLEQALSGQGMTMDDLREQIMINKSLERILADKIVVSDEEINDYLSTTKSPTTGGVSSDDARNEAREQLKARKFGSEASQWVTETRAKATIEYYGEYNALQ